MAGDWEYLSLEEAGVDLIDCVHKTPPDAGEGYAYIAIPQMKGGRIDFAANPRRITHDDFLAWTAKARPRANDVVLSRRCNPGETAHVPEGVEFALGQNLVLLRADGTRVHPPFLRWLVRGPAWWDQISKFLNVGAVFDSLRCADIPRFELPLPPLSDQRAIAHILGTLDDKIELNRQMSETLEAMARALFKSWFVDFDPVRAKIEGRAPGLPQHIADLFPDRLVDSELGEIPEGWEVAALGDLADVEKGLSYKGAGLVDEGGLPMINLGCFVGQGKFNIAKIKWYMGEYRERHLVRPGDLLIANTDMTQKRTILGSPALAPSLGSGPECLFTHHTFAFRFHPGAERWKRYVYLALLQPEFRQIAEGFATGTTVLALPQDGVLKYLVALPSESVRSVFDEHLGTLLAYSENARQQSNTLAALRDTLLPKLISGELRTKDSEKFVGQVT